MNILTTRLLVLFRYLLIGVAVHLFALASVAQSADVKKLVIEDTVKLKGVITMDLTETDLYDLAFFTSVPDSFTSYRKWKRYRNRNSIPVYNSFPREDLLLHQEIRRFTAANQPCAIDTVLSGRRLFESHSQWVKACEIEAFFWKAKKLDTYKFYQKGKLRYKKCLVLVCLLPTI